MSNFRWQLGLREKLLLVIFLVSTIGFLVLAINRVMILEGAIQSRTLFRMESIGNILSTELLPKLINKDQVGTMLLLETTTRQPLVDFVIVVDPESNIVFSSEPQLEGKMDSFPNTPNMDYFGHDQFIRSFPINNDDQEFGSLKIGFSLAQYRSDIQKTIAWSASLSILSLIFILASSWMIITMFLRPLVEINLVLE
ncbi:MAG: hypothetical protein KKD13_04250, partial [Candidatus Margulisbacteria bacterium]|nr:hypothetical protein [Candidatus Margulisiibacteriota bacterium]